MNRTRFLVWTFVVATVTSGLAFRWLQAPAPPRTPEETERREREINEGTRAAPPKPLVQAMREAREVAPARERAASEPPRSDPVRALFEHCHAAVRLRFPLTRRVVVDGDVLPPQGGAYVHYDRGKRFAFVSSEQVDLREYALLPLPVTGTYVVTGDLTAGAGAAPLTRLYDCEIFARPPLFVVTSLDFRDVR